MFAFRRTSSTETICAVHVDRGSPTPCRAHLSWFALIVFFGGVVSGADADPRLSDRETDAPVYILVIDHSGSMFQFRDMTDESGAPIDRWVYMCRLASDFVKSSPLGTTLHLYVFEGYEEVAGNGGTKQELRLLTKQFQLAEAARGEAADYVAGVRTTGRRVIEDDFPRKAQAGTALYDTLALAFDQAEFHSGRNPGANVRVMVYSDGEDTHSQKWTPATLEERFKQIVSKNRNVYLFFTPLGDQTIEPPFRNGNVAEGEAKHPIPLDLVPNTVTLRNPKTAPEQSFQIDLNYSPEHVKLLADKFATLVFESDDIKIQPLVRWPLTPGPRPTTLTVTNADQLQPDREYTARLRLQVPELDRHQIQVTPPDGIPVRFQAAGKLSIIDTGPRNGAVFAVGDEIPFFAVTLEGATVTWDFGDGQKAIGHRASHTYRKEGKFEVLVKATAPDVQDADPVTIPLKIVDIGVSLVKPTADLFAGEPVRLSCVGRGPIQRFDWFIEGTAYPSSTPNGQSIDYKFDRPGSYPVYVRAESEHGSFFSNELSLTVLSRPTLALVGPKRGEPYQYRSPVELVAEVAGKPIRAVQFSVKRSEDGQELLPESDRAVPVAVRDEATQVRLSHRFEEELTRDESLTVNATAVMVEDSSIPAPSDQMTLSAPPFAGEIVLLNEPPGGFGLNEDIGFEVRCSSHQVVDVEWDFGNGETARGIATTFRFTRHRPDGYEVRATVRTPTRDFDTGLRRIVNLVRRPPKADFRLSGVSGADRLKFKVGEVVAIADASTGDVGKAEFSVNGERLPPGQGTVTWKSPGLQQVKLSVWPSDDPDGIGPPADVIERAVRVVKIRHAVFFFVLILSIALFALVVYLCTRNQPRGWEIGVASDPDRFGPLRTKVRQFWRRRTKTAQIPMNAVVRQVAAQLHSSYWTQGDGSRTELKVSRVQRRRGQRGVLSFSDQGHGAVTFELQRETQAGRVYRLLDARAPEDDRLREVYFELREKESLPVWDYAAVAASFLVFLSLVLATAHAIYVVNL